jgi:hypothetical protein
VEAPGIQASEGDELEVGAESVRNLTTGTSARIVQLPKARQAIIDAGGLIQYTRTLVLQQRRIMQE